MKYENCKFYKRVGYTGFLSFVWFIWKQNRLCKKLQSKKKYEITLPFKKNS